MPSAARLSIASLPTLLLCAAVAHAHAKLDHTVPPGGADLTHDPRRLLLEYSEDIEPHFCDVALRGPRGTVTITPPKRPAGHPKELEVTLPALPPGTYHVRWRVMSVDTHITHGSFEFTVSG